MFFSKVFVNCILNDRQILGGRQFVIGEGRDKPGISKEEFLRVEDVDECRKEDNEFSKGKNVMIIQKARLVEKFRAGLGQVKDLHIREIPLIGT